MRKFIALLLILLPIYSLASEASKLSQLLTQIKDIKSLLSHHQLTDHNHQNELEKTELAINQIVLKMTQTEQELQKQTKQLAELNQQQLVIDTKIKAQQITLLKQLKFNYLMGLNKNHWTYLLKAEDPTKLNRLLIYNQYLSRQNSQLIQSLKTDQEKLALNKEEINSRHLQLIELKNHQLAIQKELDTHRQQHKTVLNKIASQMKSQTQQLNELLENKKNLERIIIKLQEKKMVSTDFLSHHQGKFPWPIRGRVVEKFGSKIQNSELKQNGILITAPEGHKVYAIAPGKVIFANWLPGYGLLIIIDHGRGYMSLYGNNGALYKKVDDTVTNHEVIATVGHTGGAQNNALYFAIRYQGKPIDPASLCGKLM